MSTKQPKKEKKGKKKEKREKKEKEGIGERKHVERLCFYIERVNSKELPLSLNNNLYSSPMNPKRL